MKRYIKSSKRNYGGAYDVDAFEYFTKDDILQFGYDVCNKLTEDLNKSIYLEDIYVVDYNRVVIDVTDEDENSFSSDIIIDMRKIKKPSDINKYVSKLATKLTYELFDNILHSDINSATNTSNMAAAPSVGIAELEKDNIQGEYIKSTLSESVLDELFTEYENDASAAGELPLTAEQYRQWLQITYPEYKGNVVDEIVAYGFEDNEFDDVSSAFKLVCNSFYPSDDESEGNYVDEFSETIEIPLDIDIDLDSDSDSWTYPGEASNDYTWASPSGVFDNPDEGTEWISETYKTRLGDAVDMVEHIDELLEDSLNGLDPGKYHISGEANLVFDVSGVYMVDDSYGGFDSSYSDVVFNKDKSSLVNLQITPIN